jgi:hypothetical protein
MRGSPDDVPWLGVTPGTTVVGWTLAVCVEKASTTCVGLASEIDVAGADVEGEVVAVVGSLTTDRGVPVG